MDADPTVPPKRKRYVPTYVRTAAVKKLVKENHKQCGEEFLMSLDHYVGRRIREACAVHNGGAKRLDATVAGFVGIR